MYVHMFIYSYVHIFICSYIHMYILLICFVTKQIKSFVICDTCQKFCDTCHKSTFFCTQNAK